MFSGVFIAEKVDGVGEKRSGDIKTVYVQTLLEAFLNMCMRSVLLMMLFTGIKQNFQSCDYSPQVLDYQDFQIIIRC